MARLKAQDRSQDLKKKIDETYGDDDEEMEGPPEGMMGAGGGSGGGGRPPMPMPPMDDVGGGGGMPPELPPEEELPQGGGDGGGGAGPQGDMVQVPREVVNEFMKSAGMNSLPIPRALVDKVMQAMMNKASQNSIGQSRGADGAPPSQPPMPPMPPKGGEY